MPGNRDRKNTVDKDCHKIMCQFSGTMGGVLLLIVGIFLAGAPFHRRNDFIKEGAGHLDRMRPGFDAGNVTIIPRKDSEQKAFCDDLSQMLYHALGTNEIEEIEKVVPPVCSNTMWQPVDWATNDVSDETPCEMDVAPGTDGEQIIEATVLDSVCKKLGESFGYVKLYLWLSLAGTLLSLQALYHGRKASSGTRPEEQPLLAGGGQKQEGEANANEYSSLEAGGPSP